MVKKSWNEPKLETLDIKMTMKYHKPGGKHSGSDWSKPGGDSGSDGSGDQGFGS